MAVPRNGSRPHASLDLEGAASEVSWVFTAPCGDMPGAFDVPADVLSIKAMKEWSAPLLEICAGCPFQQQCIEHVDPRGTKNSIVAGGIVWRVGKPVVFGPRTREQRDPRGSKPNSPCGTVAAYRNHRQWNEEPCEPCRTAMREDSAARYRKRVAS